MESFVALIEHFKMDAERIKISELVEEILEETGYLEELKGEGEIEAEARIENIDELKNKIIAYEEVCEDQGETATLSGFLEEVALVADIDSLEEDSDYVVLMTLHSAKRLGNSHRCIWQVWKMAYFQVICASLRTIRARSRRSGDFATWESQEQSRN